MATITQILRKAQAAKKQVEIAQGKRPSPLARKMQTRRPR